MSNSFNFSLLIASYSILTDNQILTCRKHKTRRINGRKLQSSSVLAKSVNMMFIYFFLFSTAISWETHFVHGIKVCVGENRNDCEQNKSASGKKNEKFNFILSCNAIRK